jgi:hypothetical protein
MQLQPHLLLISDSFIVANIIKRTALTPNYNTYSKKKKEKQIIIPGNRPFGQSAREPDGPEARNVSRGHSAFRGA